MPQMTPPQQTGLHWIKASASLSNGACVQLARSGKMVALGDSKNPGAEPFFYTQAELAAFLDGAKHGEFDHLLDQDA